MEIGIQCDHDHAFLTTEVENSRIARCRQASIAYMDCFNACIMKVKDGRTRQALIKQ